MTTSAASAGPLEATVRRSDIEFCCGDDGRAYYVKAHIPLNEFMAAVRYEVGEDDPILAEEPTHCWMRVCRDFEQECSVLVEAAPGSKGAFRATWIQDA
jgi:hypothetical protein